MNICAGKGKAEAAAAAAAAAAAKGFPAPAETWLDSVGDRVEEAEEEEEAEETETVAEELALAIVVVGPAGQAAAADQSEGGDRNAGRAGLYSEIVGAGVTGVAAAVD